MSSYEGKNFFETLGAFVPGYKGYKEKETRRDCDKILREAIAKRLLDRKPVIDQTIAKLTRAVQFDKVQELNDLKVRIDAIVQQVKHAARGFSGFFDTVQVKEADLDRLYRYDLGLRDKVEQVHNLVGTLSGSTDVGGTVSQLQTALQELSEIVRHRDQAITEVQ